MKIGLYLLSEKLMFELVKHLDVEERFRTTSGCSGEVLNEVYCLFKLFDCLCL